MKKSIALFLSLALLLTLSLPAAAAVTDTFVDEIVDGFDAKVVEFSSVGEDPNNSHKIAFENNPDLGATLLIKAAAPRDAKWDEYITYKMDKNIAGFEFSVMCCAGLGDPLEDISVFISKNGTEGSWQQVKTQATKYVYDEDIYINFDKAYWHQSTLMNKSKIPSGYKYIKIQLNGCTEANDVPWNVAIDTIKIYMGSDVAAPTISAEDKFVSYAELAAQKEATKTTESTTTTTTKAENTTTTTATTTKADNSTTTTATTTKADGTTGSTLKTNGSTSATVGGDVSSDATTLGDVSGDATTLGDVSGDTTENDQATDPTGDNSDVSQDASEPTEDDGGADKESVDGNDDDQPKNALPFIIIGAVVVLAAAGVVVFVVLKKKKA